MPLSRAGLEIARVWPYRELRKSMTRRDIEAAHRGGRLVRIRKGAYVDGRLDGTILMAAMAGGRVDCVSLLTLLGVFVHTDRRLHLQMDRTSTRLPARSPDRVRHFRASVVSRNSLLADIVEALAQACRCQEPLWAIATLDSALHLGVVGGTGLDEVFDRLPVRYRALRSHLDSRSEAGSESMLRVLLRRRGWRVEVQAWIPSVGRVDLLLEGWLIVECDSERHHGGWDAQRRDGRRDLAAAALGHVTIRPIAEDIFWHVESVLAAIEGLLRLRASHANGVGRSRRTRPA